MQFKQPNKLISGGAFVLTIEYSFFFFLISVLAFRHVYWWLFWITIPVTFLSSYLTFRYILHKFIYEKIKPIYKTIHTLKRIRDAREPFDFKHDILQKVNEDVARWAEQRSNEIEELKQQEEFRREFIGNVSHELKTPVFNIQGYVSTLLEGGLDDAEVNRLYLEKSEKNIERMINIINDLGVISQLESGKATLLYSSFDIVELTNEIFEILEIKANIKNITLKFNSRLSDDSHINVNADKEKIRQVLSNLIDNSIKYGKEGGRTKVSFYDMDENILVEVSDDGIGIEEHHIPHLFERFYRVDKSRSRSMGGSGLGLAIVKHIIEKHKQTINVRSAPGVGSTFSFTLEKG
jgi:two-component system, OmpR family, phosphate regulon sensor histidine kinase PhoR